MQKIYGKIETGGEFTDKKRLSDRAKRNLKLDDAAVASYNVARCYSKLNQLYMFVHFTNGIVFMALTLFPKQLMVGPVMTELIWNEILGFGAACYLDLCGHMFVAPPAATF
ncbi:unnamed protein product [Vicia faba]|uniref:Uncharacterized protein n=1 Tax=Vicia faba TaxID=3906 RepID=A0AAV1BAL9_VICFA|nr:unnamed protein product [Vicia faba]